MFQSRILGGPALCCEVVPASLRQSPMCVHTLASAIVREIISMVILFYFSLLVTCEHCVLFKNAIQVKC